MKDNSLDSIKFKKFEELEKDEFNEIKLDDFKKAQIDEFKNKELNDFKNYLDYTKTDINIEDLRSKLNSDNAIKNILKELESIGLDGQASLKLLKRLKF